MAKATILFLDDEERILRSLKLLFISKYNVQTTTSGHEALEILKKEKIHVLISDQRMPEMMGVDVLRQAREVSPNTMRLLLTGYSDLAAIVGSINEGEIFRYINKPWQAEEVKAIIKQAADIAIQLDQSSTVDNAVSKPIEIRQQSAGLNFLVIDPDSATYHAVRGMLDEQHKVHWTPALDQAYEVLAKEPVSIVISEVELDGEDITDSIKTLKQYCPDILTIVLTSFQDTKTLITLINHGQVYRFLPKPIHNSLLSRSIDATIRHYQALKYRPQLMMRHTVAKTKDTDAIATVKHPASNKVMDFIRKIRSRAQATI